MSDKYPEGYKYVGNKEDSKEATLLAAMKNQEENSSEDAKKVVPQQCFKMNPDLTAENVVIDNDVEYLLLLTLCNSDDEDQVWEKIVGRTKTYEKLRLLIEEIDLDHSYVVPTKVTIKDAKTAYVFMRWCIDSGYVLEDDLFHLDEYTDNPISFLKQPSKTSKGDEE